MPLSEEENKIERLSLSDYNCDSSDDYDDDDDDDEEEMVVVYHPITAPTLSFDTLSAAVKYDSENSHFNILSHLQDKDPDTFFERAIVLVNKCRDFVQEVTTTSEGNTPVGHRLNEFLSSQSPSEEDEMKFFKPVLEEDAYLFDLDELLLLCNSATTSKTKGEELKSSYPSNASNENAMLQMRISSLEEQLQMAKDCILKLTDKEKSVAGTDESRQRKKRLESDSNYFSSYSHYSIHDTMLRDYVRTKSYEDAILHHDKTCPHGIKKNIFYNKIIIDVGCGTGILSLFAAKAGAKKVYALDGSKDIANCARKNILENGYENIISVTHTKVEEWVFPPEEEKADIIISEWMGYALLFESMLPSVLYARDNFMKDDKGIVYPNVARMYIEGASDDQLDFWENVHGMKMQSMKRIVELELATEASVEVVAADKIVTDRCELISFDMNTVKNSDLDFKANYTLKGCGKVNKFVLSFDIDFVESNVSFSTGCQTTPTHWNQTTLWLDSIVSPELSGDGEELRGSISMNRNKDNDRGYDFDLKWEVVMKGKNKARCDGSVKSTLTP